MITVINKTNKSLYYQLFNDVQEWLYTHDSNGNEVEKGSDNALLGKVKKIVDGEEVVTEELEIITSLEELFSCMRALTRYAPNYTRLPLDEEPFFIDANARTISVPADFAKNGISVQGDEVSEILFFKVNRFFDATDLNTCDIFIQWKSSETDEFGRQKEGVSRPWIKDISSEPGYLIFGWPISSKITKAAGAVTFSVRFYHINSVDELDYSFSTLDQTVSIKPALDYDIEDIFNDTSKVIVDDASSIIKERARSSKPSAADMIAEMPYWEPGIENGLKGWTQEYKANGDIKFEVMNLGADEEGFSTQPIQLYTAALSDDSGLVSLFWSKTVKIGDENVSKETIADGSERFFNNLYYRPTDTTEEERRSDALKAKTFYISIGNNTYKPVKDSESLNDLRESGEIIYELGSLATLDEVGKYTASAENRVGKVYSDELRATPIYVPSPEAPELGAIEVEESTGPILRENQPVNVSLEVTLKDMFGNDVANKGGKATYEWHRRLLDEATPLEEPVGVDEVLILTSPDEEEGYYSVTVTNNLNKEAKASESNELRITKPAVKPILTIAAEDEISIDTAKRDGLPVNVSGLEPHREPVENGGEDDVVYQWYRYYTTGSNTYQDKEDAKNGTYEIHGDKKINELTELGDLLTEQVLSSSISPTFFPPVTGTYFCVVTNKYNGTEATAISPFYDVKD